MLTNIKLYVKVIKKTFNSGEHNMEEHLWYRIKAAPYLQASSSFDL